MSDIDLPLWNKEETDVLPEYQMSYGHVLCQGEIDEDSVETLRRSLGLPRRRDTEGAGPTHFPRDPSGKHYTLGGLTEAHLLVVGLGDYSAIFGPHVLFLTARDWIKWDKKVRRLMAVATRLDIVRTFYTVFRDGQYQANAASDNERVWFPEIPEVEVYVNREEVFRSSREEVQHVDEIVSMLRCDVELGEDGGNVYFQKRFSNEQVPLSRARHYVFGA
jgi:hypothetical protein